MGNFNKDDKAKPRRDFARSGFDKRSFRGHSRKREMHKAVCSNCGKDCEVPFEPTAGKPVYCSECFEKMGGRTDSRRPDFEIRTQPGPQKNEQLEAISQKLDKIIEILEANTPKKEKEIELKPEEIVLIPKKKTKTSKKKTPVKKE